MRLIFDIMCNRQYYFLDRDWPRPPSQGDAVLVDGNESFLVLGVIWYQDGITARVRLAEIGGTRKLAWARRLEELGWTTTNPDRKEDPPLGAEIEVIH